MMHKFLTPNELDNYRSMYDQWKTVSNAIRERGTQEFLDLKAGDTILLNGVGFTILRVNIKSLRVKRIAFMVKKPGKGKRIDTIPVYLNDKYRIISRHEAAVIMYFGILRKRYGESCLFIGNDNEQ